MLRYITNYRLQRIPLSVPFCSRLPDLLSVPLPYTNSRNLPGLSSSPSFLSYISPVSLSTGRGIEGKDKDNAAEEFNQELEQIFGPSLTNDQPGIRTDPSVPLNHIEASKGNRFFIDQHNQLVDEHHHHHRSEIMDNYGNNNNNNNTPDGTIIHATSSIPSANSSSSTSSTVPPIHVHVTVPSVASSVSSSSMLSPSSYHIHVHIHLSNDKK